MKNILIQIILFLFGGTAYALIEVLWRGSTHWSMLVLGGICFLAIIYISKYYQGKRSLIEIGLISSVVITALEFITGCVVNLMLGWNIWNYSSLPYNLMGQVCISFMALWFLLCIPVAAISKKMYAYLGEKI